MKRLSLEHLAKVQEQVQAALQQKNWSLLTQYLQQWLISDETVAGPEGTAMTSALGDPCDLAIAILTGGDFQARWDVAKLFPALGDRAIAPLIQLLQDKDADLEARWFAGRILSRYTYPTAIIALVDLLETTESEELSSMAADALATVGTPALTALTDLLAQAETRLPAVRALAQIRHSDTIAPLLTVVNDAQPTIRAIAIEALSSFHDPRVPPVLVQALADTAAVVRCEAVVGLGMRPDLAEALNLVPLLTDRLHDINLTVCQKAAIALGRMQTDAAAAALFHTLQAAPTPLMLRLDCVRALGWMGSPIALDYLHRALFQLEPSAAFAPVDQEIVAVLGRWAAPDLKPQAAQALVDLLTLAHPGKANPAVRKAIAVGLGQLAQKRALDPLMQLLADADDGVRLHAVAALKTLDRQAAHQRLKTLAASADVPDSLRQGVAIALQEW